MSEQPERLAEAIGRRLAARREDADIRPAELARLADISQPYLHQIEGGDRTPSVEVLLRLADAVGCEPCQLLKDEATV